MSQAKIILHKCIHDSQEYGSDDEHMVSRVFFTIDTQSKVYSKLYVDIKQAVKGKLEIESLEVGSPVGYEGPFDHKLFQNAVKQYYRNLVASKSSNTRMCNDTLVKEISFSMELAEAGGPRRPLQ